MTDKTAKKVAKVAPKGNFVVGEPRAWDKGVFLAAKFMCKEADFSALIKHSKWDHYVYGLCLDNGAVFYVGKGVKNRAIEHSKDAARGDNSEKSRYIREIGERIRYTLFLQCSDSDFAMGYEAYLIHGHHDVLTNIAPASEAAFQRMFQSIDPIRRDLESLAYVNRYIKRANAECRASMKSIIEGFPAIEKTLTPEEIEWMNEECAHG